MFRTKSPRFPGRRRLPCLASTVCAAGALLMPLGCDLTMAHLVGQGPSVPGTWSSGVTPPLSLAPGDSADETASPIVHRTAYHAQAPGAIAQKEVVVDFDSVLRMAREGNARILLARERVNESQVALDAAIKSHTPEFLRKEIFKRPNAEAQLQRRRAELSKVQHEVQLEAANTYFDLLTARRAEVVARDLEKYELKLLERARRLADSEKPAQVLVEAIESALSARRQYIAKVHQQGDGAVAKLAYLLGLGDGVPTPADSTLMPVDLVDAVVPADALVRQSLDYGPGVRELQALAAAIQAGIDQANCAQRLCDRTAAATVCGRLQIARSQLEQANLALLDLRGKLRAGVEEARSAILSGREQITRGTTTIQHAAETYRITNLRLESDSPRESMLKNTYSGVLRSLQQLNQAHASYLSAVSDYNKAEARLLLLLGTNSDTQPNPH